MIEIKTFKLTNNIAQLELLEPFNREIIEATVYNKSKFETIAPIVSIKENVLAIELPELPDYGMYGFKIINVSGRAEILSLSELANVEISPEDYNWKKSTDTRYFLQNIRRSVSEKRRDIVVNKIFVEDGFLKIKITKKFNFLDFKLLIGSQKKSEIEEREIPFFYNDSEISIQISSIDQLTFEKYYFFLVHEGIYYRLYWPKMAIEKNYANRHILVKEDELSNWYFYFTVNNRLALKQVNAKYSQDLESRRTINNATNEYSKYEAVFNAFKNLALKDVRQITDTQYKIRLIDESARISRLWFVETKNRDFVKVPFQQNGNVITVDLNDITDNFSDEVERFTLYAIFRTKHRWFNFAKLQKRSMATLGGFRRFFNASDIQGSENNLATRIYFSKSGTIALLNRPKFITDEKERPIPMAFRLKNIHKGYNQLSIALWVDLKRTPWMSKIEIIEAFLYKTSFIDERKTLNVNSVTLDTKEILLTADLQNFFNDDDYGYYRLGLSVKINDKIFTVRVNNPTGRFKQELSQERVMFSIGNKMVFPSIEGNTLSLFIDNAIFLDKRFNIKQEAAISNRFEANQIPVEEDKVLLFEKETNYAQDNSFALFKWIQENVSNNKVYYVIRKDSAQLGKVLPYKSHVIFTGTRSYYEHVASAQMLVSSDSPLHLVGDVNRRNASPFYKKVIMKKPFVMLQHGVTAMKSHAKNRPWMASSGMIDYFVVTNTLEQEVVHDSMGYEYDQLPILGFSRWDLFGKNTIQEQTFNGKILYVPTWRQWLNKATDEEFIQSDYYRNITQLLEDEKLADVLQKRDTELNVYLHPFMQRLTHNLKTNNSRIKILSSDDYDLGDLLRGGALLISDYSSVVWDFAVQRKPVIFYQFDKELYLEKVGSLVDLDTLPIGNSMTQVSEVVDAIDFYAERKFTLTEDVESDIQNIFGDVRSDYSKQIYEWLMTVSKGYRNTVWRQGKK